MLKNNPVQSTLQHKEHLQMKKITQKEIDELTEKLKADQAEFNDSRTDDTRKNELRGTLRDQNENIYYLQEWLNGGCKEGTFNSNKGAKLIAKAPKGGGGWEITIKE